VLIIYDYICHDETLIKYKKNICLLQVVPKLSCKTIYDYRIFAENIVNMKKKNNIVLMCVYKIYIFCNVEKKSSWFLLMVKFGMIYN